MGSALTCSASRRQCVQTKLLLPDETTTTSTHIRESTDELSRFLSGENLASIVNYVPEYASPVSTEICKKYLFGICKTLMGYSPVDRFCYSIAEAECAKDNDSTCTEFWQLFFTIVLSVYMDDYNSAEVFLKELDKRFRHTIEIPRAIEDCLIFYRGLVAAVLASRCHNRRQNRRLQMAKKELRRLQSRRNQGDPSLSNKVFLLEAQIHVCREQHESALLLFHQSCEYADHQGLSHEQALAFELAGQMCQNCHREDESDLYLTQAQAIYGRWGAEAKVENMDRLKSSVCNRTQSTSSF